MTSIGSFPFAADLRQIIRQEMENNRNCNDKQRIRFLISDGIERVKRLDETLDMQGHWFNCNVYMVCLTSCNVNPVVTYRINQRRAANIGGSCALAISAWFMPCCRLRSYCFFPTYLQLSQDLHWSSCKHMILKISLDPLVKILRLYCS